MDKWEYRTWILRANANEAEERNYLARTYPNWKPKLYSPEALEPRLNELGNEGWELLSVLPVEVGRNSDVMTGFQNAMTSTWSNAYLCVLKRRKPS